VTAIEQVDMKPAVVRWITDLYRDESAVTTVEYALVAALFAAVAAVAATQLVQSEKGSLTRDTGYFGAGH
jgi:Flp pilus assembly pilin Flp